MKYVIVGLIVAIIVIIGCIVGFFAIQVKSDEKHQVPNCIWYDRKRNLLGLPWSFVKYSISTDRLFIQQGLLHTIFDEVRLYRVLDIKLEQSLLQKLTNLGTITVHSSDKSLGCFALSNVKNPMEVKELLSENVELQRDAHRVYNREVMSDNDIDDNIDEES